MYRRNLGIQRLQTLSRDFALTQQAIKRSQLRVHVRGYGYDAPPAEDSALLARAVPYFSLEPPTEPGSLFDFVTSADSVVAEGGQVVERDHAAGVTSCFASIVRFLTCLSISTSAILCWRRLAVLPTELAGIDLVTGDAKPVEIAPTGDIGGSQGPIHAGHLACAVDLFARIGS
jgi:hypothetical protein